MNYFRAILHRDERSERSLQLTEEVINMNPANYTVWYFRRLLIDTLGIDLIKELEFVTRVGRQHPKNYQIWNHRRVIVEKSKKYSNELEFTSEMIDEDSGKNYHAWAHRQWVIETFDLWKDELAYVDDSLKLDSHNNSAWNQRYFVVAKHIKLTPDVIKTEIQYSLKFISKKPNNASPWAYLKGIMQGMKYGDFPEVKAKCVEWKDSLPACSHHLSLLIDIFEQEGTPESITHASELCIVLASRLDTIRQKYWQWRADNLKIN